MKQQGLLSTAALLGRYGLDPEARREIMTRRRAKSIILDGPELPHAVIRDHKPMEFLLEKIEPGTSVEDFLLAIKSRVFFPGQIVTGWRACAMLRNTEISSR